MSDTRDDTTGQFASAEPLYGRAAEEREAGWVPLPEEKKDDEPEELTVREAAEELASRTPESEIVTYSALDGLADNVALTVDQASKILSDSRDADAAQAEIEQTAKLQREVDELRGVEPAKADKPEAEARPVRDGEIDPELERALNNPKVRDAIQQQIGESEQARQNYLTNLDAATKIAQVSFVSQFPEFANLPAEQHGAMLAAIQQQQPERFQQIYSAVERSAGLFAQQGAEQQRQAERERTEFQTYAKAEDARFAEMVKGEPPAQMRAIENEIPAMLKSVGVDPLEFLKAGSESKFLRSAAAQAILVKAAKYDLMQKAPRAVATRAVPPVQRPGVARPSGQADASERVQALNRKSELTLKEATELVTLERRSRKA